MLKLFLFLFQIIPLYLIQILSESLLSRSQHIQSCVTIVLYFHRKGYSIELVQNLLQLVYHRLALFQRLKISVSRLVHMACLSIFTAFVDAVEVVRAGWENF